MCVSARFMCAFPVLCVPVFVCLRSVSHSSQTHTRKPAMKNDKPSP